VKGSLAENARRKRMSRKIHLDFNASTPIASEAVEAMRPLLADHYGNPSSLHWAGMPAKDAVEKARGQVAGLLGCDPTEVVFTSGGSESNNHAIKGVFFANRNRGDHIITTAVEHPATINPCRFLEKLGAKVTVLPVDRYGMVDPDDIRRATTHQDGVGHVIRMKAERTANPVQTTAFLGVEMGFLADGVDGGNPLQLERFMGGGSPPSNLFSDKVGAAQKLADPVVGVDLWLEENRPHLLDIDMSLLVADGIFRLDIQDFPDELGVQTDLDCM
jgi:hypothetical protein